MMEFFIFIIDEVQKLKDDVVEADFDYEKNRNVQHYFVYLKNSKRFDVTTIKELKEKAKQIGEIK